MWLNKLNVSTQQLDEAALNEGIVEQCKLTLNKHIPVQWYNISGWKADTMHQQLAQQKEAWPGMK